MVKLYMKRRETKKNTNLNIYKTKKEISQCLPVGEGRRWSGKKHIGRHSSNVLVLMFCDGFINFNFICFVT